MGLIKNQFNNGNGECQAAYSGPRAHIDSLSRVVPHFFFRARVPQPRGRVPGYLRGLR